MNVQRVELLFHYTEKAYDAKKINVAWLEIEKELGIKLNDIEKKKDEALIIYLQDTSGSVGIWEKYVSNEYFQYAENEIKNKYSKVTNKYISFHTAALEFNSLEELNKNNSTGGTIVSSGLSRAKEIVNENLDKNIYVFLLSDGDNLTSDNAKCLVHLEEIFKNVNYFQYFETNQYNRKSTLMDAFKKINNKKFNTIIAKHKDDALKGYRFKEVLEGEDK